jgi:hypothetical protein
MPSDFTRATAGSHEPAAAKAPPLTTAGRAARPAVAGTLWGELVLGAGAVTPGVLAHEMAHVLQTERFGARGARDSVTTPEAPDEREAQELAPRILRGNRVEAMQAPTAALQLWSPTDAPTLPHAEELRDATREGDANKVIDILASYHSAGQMAALREDYGPGLVRDITRAFQAGRTKTLWSLARTYLGDHLTVAEKIFIDHAVFGLEAERIMAEIHGLSDQQALRIVLSEDGLPSLRLDSSEDLGPGPVDGGASG